MNPVLIDGVESRNLDVRNRGLAYGDALFETIRVVAGRCPLLTLHLERLDKGSQRLGIPCDGGTLESLRSEVESIAGAIGPAGIVKVLLVRGGNAAGYGYLERDGSHRVVMGRTFEDAATDAQQGIEVLLSTIPMGLNPALAGLKHTNRLEQVMASRELTGSDCREAVLLDVDGWLIEGTRTNLFLRVGNALVTPDLSRCGVEGVMRRVIMALSLEEADPCLEQQVDVELVAGADEVFLCNSVIGIWPVRSLRTADRVIGRWQVGYRTRQIQDRIRQETGIG